MNAFLLMMIIVFASLQSVSKKAFSEKVSGGVYIFSALSSLAAILFFVATAVKPEFNTAFLPYSAGFGIAYAVSLVFGFMAIECGSLSLTTLMTSYSLMIPMFYGLIFLKEQVSDLMYAGIILLFISIVLINKRNGDNVITVKWLIYVFLSFVGNGMCSVVQKMQQNAFGGAYKSEFMIAALALVTVILAVCSIIKERKNFALYLKKGWGLALGCGLMNGAVNLFVMFLSGKMPVSIMFPSISAGGIVITFLISKFLYKEKLSRRQLWGFGAGILSIIFLSI